MFLFTVPKLTNEDRWLECNSMATQQGCFRHPEFGDCENCGTDIRFGEDEEPVRFLHLIARDIRGVPLCPGCYAEILEYTF